MRRRLLSQTLQLAAVAMCFFATAGSASAQGTAASPPSKTEIVLSKASPPVYPPLARQARIAGDVKIQVVIRQDGSVASAEVISGHPVLKQAALESAQQSTFECENWLSGVYSVGCRDASATLMITYTFGFRDDIGDADRCSVKRLHSAQCLYLWKCGGWRFATGSRTPVVGHSADHVIVLADAACLETETAR
jgi:TonB family protein